MVIVIVRAMVKVRITTFILMPILGQVCTQLYLIPNPNSNPVYTLIGVIVFHTYREP